MQERRWYGYTRENIEKLPKGAIGGYLLGDIDKKPIRPGSSGSEGVSIRGRLISHFIHNSYPSAKYFKFLYADSKEEAREIERKTYEKHIKNNPQMKEYTKRIPRKIDNWFWD